jgi:LemA protein
VRSDETPVVAKKPPPGPAGREAAMSTAQIGWGVAAAALLFWMVGAYNRLMRLRGEIVRRFPPVDQQFVLRQALLQEQIDLITPALPDAASRIEALRAAVAQVGTACAHARLRPGASGTITSLRLADDILVETRARLPVLSVAGVDLTDLNARLGASDATLAFARGQFNDAVMEYNAAVKQFPTVLIVGPFGFRSAGTL